jgi:hypothetical protein
MAWLEYNPKECGFTADELMDALVSSGFVDCMDGQLFVHDWADHMPNFVYDRIRKRKERGSKPRQRLNLESPGQSETIQENPDASASVGERRCAAPPSPSPSPSLSSSSKNKKPPLSPKGERIRSMVGVELPKAIDTVDVRAALTEWLVYKGGYKPVGITKLVKVISSWTPEQIVAAVDSSIANTYIGLTPAKTQPQPTLPGMSGNGCHRKKAPITLLPVTDGSDDENYRRWERSIQGEGDDADISTV